GNCRSSSSKEKFGLCDDPHPAKNPAYINDDNPLTWIAVVHNKSHQQIVFYAIDHCIEIIRSDGKQEKRCDGVIKIDNSLIFVELKSSKRNGSGWLKDGIKQIAATIDVFKDNVDIGKFDKIEAYVCNQLKPFANQGHTTQIQRFKDDTGGIILRAQRDINLSST
ncbi:MAG: hypothetical protein MI922_15230, partial [Bacteroidales bacterium]|nr:hypothetical protein [Bacteroidales bacterium]